MSDFKLLGGTDPANNELGEMTQGLGYPLRKVDAATSGGQVTVKTETVLDALSFDDQDPTGLGVPMQVTFGGAQSTPEWSIDALGAATCLLTDEYSLLLKTASGRSGGGGESQLYLRVLINGTQVGNSIHTIVDNQRIEMPLVVDGTALFTAGDVVTVELIRDTDGNDSGGLRAGIPDVAGWNPSPSAILRFTRTYAVETNQ